MREVFLIANPVAGGYRDERMHAAVAALEARGCRVTAMLTSRRGDAEASARRAAREGIFSCVLAAGGDGTYNEVANGLAGSDTPMAILPLGTKSVLARELGIPARIQDAVEIALVNAPRPAHLGRITCAREFRSLSDAATSESRFFLLMAGFGFDGEAVYGVNEAVKRYAGQAAYILSGLSAFVRHHPSPLSIAAVVAGDRRDGDRLQESGVLQGGEVTVEATVAIVGKAACYGGDYTITPKARLTEPTFSVFYAKGRRRTDLLRYLSAIILRKRLVFSDTGYLTATALSVSGAARIQIDGDYAGVTPATVEVVPDALRLICSRGYGA